MFGPILRGKVVTLVPTPKDLVALWPKWLADLDVTRYLVRRFVPSPQQAYIHSDPPPEHSHIHTRPGPRAHVGADTPQVRMRVGVARYGSLGR